MDRTAIDELQMHGQDIGGCSTKWATTGPITRR